MQSLAIALGPYKIRCNSLLPGCILTDINRYQLDPGSELRNYFEKRIPLGRIGFPRRPRRNSGLSVYRFVPAS